MYDLIPVPESITAFLQEVRDELLRARTKFPGDRVMTIALTEEVGELAKALLQEPRENVRREAVQVAVMAARIVLDGDSSVTDWRLDNGLDPLLEAVAVPHVSPEGRFMIHNNGFNIFVKSVAYFATQGGFSHTWGRNWIRVSATNVEEAREFGIQMRRDGTWPKTRSSITDSGVLDGSNRTTSGAIGQP